MSFLNNFVALLVTLFGPLLVAVVAGGLFGPIFGFIAFLIASWYVYFQGQGIEKFYRGK